MGEIILQSGSDSVTGSKDVKLNTLAIRVKCWASDLATAISGACPSIGMDMLVENQPRTFSRSLAGDVAGYDVTITLEGRPDAKDGESWTIEGTTSDDPIESHPDYALLLSVYGGTEDAATNRAKWPKTIGENGDRNPMHGVENYLLAGLVLTRKTTSERLPQTFTHTLGCIDTPPRPRNGLMTVPLTGKRQWFKVRARASERGNVVEYEESWLLTGPQGVAPEMYRYYQI